MAQIDLSLFDISTIEARCKKRNPQRYRHDNQIVHECDRPACSEPAYYKAPKSPSQLNQYRYFCLKHIREHNQRWDYCENMTQEEIISHLEKDVVGHRPTWQSGMSVKSNNYQNARYKKQQSQMHHSSAFSSFDDPFNLAEKIFDTINPEETQKKSQKQKTLSHYDSGLQKIHDACLVLSVDFPPIFAHLKENYKKLVKQYHPDINKQDVDAEKKLRKIIEAYRLIKDFLGK